VTAWEAPALRGRMEASSVLLCFRPFFQTWPMPAPWHRHPSLEDMQLVSAEMAMRPQVLVCQSARSKYLHCLAQFPRPLRRLPALPLCSSGRH
jgi:hypothetical protein